MTLHQLVYVSRARTPLRSIMDVSDILEEAVRHNPANNITGALAFTESRFVQLIEGSPGSIDVLLLRLLIDPRHTDLVIVDRIPVAARSFPSWSMVSPVFTPSARTRLEAMVSDALAPIGAFRSLLLEMIAEQDVALAAGDPTKPGGGRR